MSDLSGSNWTETDAGNNTTPPLGWPEGQMPSTVNDCSRMMMGALKRFWNRLNGAITTTGSSYTYTTANTTYPAAYVTGETFRFKAHRTSTGGDQMQVNSLAAKPLYKRSSTGPVTIGAGDIVTGDMVSVTYDGSLNASAGGFWCNDNVGALQKTDASITYVSKSGDTITGGLTVNANLSVGGAGYFDNGQVVIGSNGLSYFGSNQIAFTWDSRVQIWVDRNNVGHIAIADGNNNLSLNGFYGNYVSSSGDINASGAAIVGSLTCNGDINAGSGGGNNFHFNGNIHIQGPAGLYMYDRSNSSLYCAPYTQSNQLNLYFNASNNSPYSFDANGTLWLRGNAYVIPASNGNGYVGLAAFAYAGMESYNYYTPSDERTKTGIADLPDCLDLVRQINPKRYRLKDVADDTREHWGFIAQDVGKVMGSDFAGYRPAKSDDEHDALNYNDMLAILWRAVAELSAKVADK